MGKAGELPSGTVQARPREKMSPLLCPAMKERTAGSQLGITLKRWCHWWADTFPARPEIKRHAAIDASSTPIRRHRDWRERNDIIQFLPPIEALLSVRGCRGRPCATQPPVTMAVIVARLLPPASRLRSLSVASPTAADLVKPAGLYSEPIPGFTHSDACASSSSVAPTFENVFLKLACYPSGGPSRSAGRLHSETGTRQAHSNACRT